MNKLFLIVVVGLLLVGIVGFISYNELKEEYNMKEQIYQGPVPLGYNLEHFRKTGETIKEENN